MSRCIALIRGINVGRAKRVAMADLRDSFEKLGLKNTRTVLNSGNVVFEAPRPNSRELALCIENQIEKRFGFSAAVVVMSETGLAAVIRENPLGAFASDPARLLVAFVSGPGTLATAKSLLAEPWAPDVLAIGTRAAYLWCPNGVLESKLVKAFSRITGDCATTRNWATVLKLQAAAGSIQDGAGGK
jgi:uncharacterized protein (DUF1697 family)